MHASLENRKVHKTHEGCEKGSFAGLSEKLHQQGYEYQYKAGQPSYSETGIAHFQSAEGKKVALIRVAKGASPKWHDQPAGAATWLAYTSQQPDTWQLVPESD